MVNSIEGTEISTMGSTPASKILSGVSDADLVRSFKEKSEEAKSERVKEAGKEPRIEIIFDKGVF